MSFQASDGSWEEARREAERDRPLDQLIDRLVERFGGRTGVHMIYSDPVERDRVTVIPVARVRWAVGAGAGSGRGPAAGSTDEGATAATSEGEGVGGGGGIIGDPVGYIEISSSGATFRPIRGVPNPLAILTLGVSLALVIRALARLLGR